MDSLKKNIIAKIAKVMARVCEHPLICVSETDLHALMISELFRIPQLDPFARLYCTDRTIGLNKKGVPSKNKYKTMLVHKEYGHNEYRKARSDIVIFDPCDVKEIDSIKLVSDKKKGMYNSQFIKKGRGQYLQPRFIFEFGLETATSSLNLFREHLKQDLQKVAESEDTGFLIHIQRFFAESKINDKNIFQYKAIVRELWKEKGNTKIKPLILFIKIGNKNQVIGSKIDMFDPYNLEKPWKNIAHSRIGFLVNDLLMHRAKANS